ncbi:hypothetical protein T4D_12941 [Trichinella pseudospiralis]|uniref:Uncharacterized protein n=1 Tax=Trichinella pseudospiralis TaxID=6337 RepID=A0A0V1DKQ7_TRIPS|nr:hypothetical protein T4D_12941 [Trichinella pseudospiralis]
MLIHSKLPSFFKISRQITFSRNFRIFLKYRLACFAKNGEKFLSKLGFF